MRKFPAPPPRVSSSPSQRGVYRRVTEPFIFEWSGEGRGGFGAGRVYRVHVPAGMQGRTSGLHALVVMIAAVAWTFPHPWGLVVLAAGFVAAVHYRYVLEAGSLAHDALYLWHSRVRGWIDEQDPRRSIARQIRVEALDYNNQWRPITSLARSEADRVLLHVRRDPVFFRLYAYVIVTLMGAPVWNDWLARLKRRVLSS